jgi:hypothetical protein
MLIWQPFCNLTGQCMDLAQTNSGGCKKDARGYNKIKEDIINFKQKN